MSNHNLDYWCLKLFPSYKKMLRDFRRSRFEQRFQSIAEIESEMENIAISYMPDYHHMTHQISYSCECEDSPIGLCVWDTSENGFNNNVVCHYCDQPVERK